MNVHFIPIYKVIIMSYKVGMFEKIFVLICLHSVVLQSSNSKLFLIFGWLERGLGALTVYLN